MRYFIALLFFSSFFGLTIKAQIGVNTTDPTEFLDIDGNIRIRNAVNIESLADPSGYASQLKMNSKGVWGYVKDRKPNNYTFYNVYSYEMKNPVVSTTITPNQSEGISVPLGVSIKVEIPPRSAAIFFIDYNIPISIVRRMDLPIESFNINYVGFTLFKTGDIELQDGSRKFTVFRPASEDVASVGMPVLGKSVQKVENTTDKMMYIDYYLTGYIETNPLGLTVRFGGFAPIYQTNGGKGMMTIKSFVKDIPST